MEEAQTETTACLLECAETGSSARLLSAIAYQTRLEYLLYRMRHRYLVEAEERQVDDFELAFADLRALLEIVFEKLEPSSTKAISLACDRAVRAFVEGIVEALANQENDTIEDLLFLRDQIEYARIALRSHSWISQYVDILELDPTLENLSLGDVLLKMNIERRSKQTRALDRPDNFFWRFRSP